MSFASIRPSGATPLVEINITPLVDVLLTVLIIFMIVAPVVTKKIVLPLNGSGSEATEAHVLGVSIDEFGQLRLDDRAVSLRELDAAVGAAGSQARLRMELRPRAQTPYDDVAKVLALARRHEIADLRVESMPTH